MTRKRYNFAAGAVQNNPLLAEDDIIQSEELAKLPPVASPDYMVVVLDPGMTSGLEPEIVYVVEHIAGSTAAVVERGREQHAGGSAPREHIKGTMWIHGLTVDDLIHSNLSNLEADDHPQYVRVDADRDFTATPKVNGSEVWHQGNMGSTSGLDADLLDGLDSEAYSKVWVHDQSQASSVWVINHNLGRFPGVTVIDSAGTQVVGDIQYNSSNTITITFSSAFAGKAHLD